MLFLSGHVASGTPQLEGEKKDVPHLKRLEPQNSLGHQLFVKESSTHLPIGNFIAPLDQSTDEFFGLEQPMDVEGNMELFFRNLSNHSDLSR